jgi:hypothetical protein
LGAGVVSRIKRPGSDSILELEDIFGSDNDDSAFDFATKEIKRRHIRITLSRAHKSIAGQMNRATLEKTS